MYTEQIEIRTSILACLLLISFRKQKIIRLTTNPYLLKIYRLLEKFQCNAPSSESNVLLREKDKAHTQTHVTFECVCFL